MAKMKNESVDKGMMMYSAAGQHMVNYAETKDVTVEKAPTGYQQARGMGDAMGGVKFKVK